MVRRILFISVLIITATPAVVWNVGFWLAAWLFYFGPRWLIAGKKISEKESARLDSICEFLLDLPYNILIKK